MHKVQKSSNESIEKDNKSYVVNYRFINAKSLKTDESINIGIIIDKNDGHPIIKLVNNLEVFYKLFPIFDVQHANVCLDIIKTKYKLKKVKHIKMDISKTISLSNIKTHKEISDLKDKDIENIIYEKYFTLSKTEKTLMLFYQSYNIKEMLSKKVKKYNKYIDDKVITQPLINDIPISPMTKRLKEKIQKYEKVMDTKVNI